MYGIHGTCVSLAEKINEEGFKKSITGRAGPGVYFWRYFSDPTYASYLGYEWWKYSDKRGNYNKKHITNKKCCLIQAEIIINDGIVFDLSHGRYKESLRNFINSGLQRLKGQPDYDLQEENEVSALFELFVAKVEKMIGKRITAIITDVAVPKGSGKSIGKYFGASSEAIIVLDTNNIKILSSEEVENYDY